MWAVGSEFQQENYSRLLSIRSFLALTATSFNPPPQHGKTIISNGVHPWGTETDAGNRSALTLEEWGI